MKLVSKNFCTRKISLANLTRGFAAREFPHARERIRPLTNPASYAGQCFMEAYHALREYPCTILNTYLLVSKFFKSIFKTPQSIQPYVPFTVFSCVQYSGGRLKTKNKLVSKLRGFGQCLQLSFRLVDNMIEELGLVYMEGGCPG